MPKKLVTSAENLASLDLLIANKEAGEAPSLFDEIIIIIIIIFGRRPVFVHPPRVTQNEYPVFSVLESLVNSIESGGFRGASVGELMELRRNIEVQK